MPTDIRWELLPVWAAVLLAVAYGLSRWGRRREP